MRIQKTIAAVLIICILSPVVFSQTPGEPVPWGPADFPQWQKDLRRAEIIAFGALPFVTLIGSLVYDVLRYYQHDRQEGYLPWPLKKQNSAVPFTEDEQKNILITAAGLSVGVAATDFIVRYIRRQRQGRTVRSVNPGHIFIEEIDTPDDDADTDQSEWIDTEPEEFPELRDGPELD